MTKVELNPIAPKVRLTPEALFQAGWEEAFPGEGEVEKVREYLGQFIQPHYKGEPPNHKRHCANCGMEMDGMMQALGLLPVAAFQWGLVNGEAFCSNCKYPARANHRPKMEGATEPLFTMVNLYLEYFDVEVEAEIHRIGGS